MTKINYRAGKVSLEAELDFAQMALLETIIESAAKLIVQGETGVNQANQLEAIEELAETLSIDPDLSCDITDESNS